MTDYQSEISYKTTPEALGGVKTFPGGQQAKGTPVTQLCHI